jgi:ribosomal protein S18 acetylase RimI-like enzyme
LSASLVEFRSATAADAPAIVALVESAYRGEASRQGWTTEADLLDGQRTDLDEVLSILGDPGAHIALACAGDELLGSVLMRDEAGTAYIGMLAVRPDQQAHGLGRQLLEHAEGLARSAWSATRARMTVIIQRDDLIRWYERRGYRRTSGREPFPYGNPRFGLPRRPDLEFIVLEKPLPP